MAHDIFEHFSKTGGHKVVQDGVDNRAEVEKHPRDDVDILEDLQVVISPVRDEAPHEAVGVKWGPADPEDHYQNNYEERGRDSERENEGTVGGLLLKMHLLSQSAWTLLSVKIPLVVLC